MGSHVSRILDTIAMPVIEQALFKEVQGKLEASRRESEHRNSPHLLSGLVRCGRCGRPMWRMNTRKEVHYYRCNATSSSCEAGLFKADPVERAVLDAVSETVPSAKNLDPWTVRVGGRRSRHWESGSRWRPPLTCCRSRLRRTPAQSQPEARIPCLDWNRPDTDVQPPLARIQPGRASCVNSRAPGPALWKSTDPRRNDVFGLDDLQKD